MRLLLDHGARVDEKDKGKGTALICAAQGGHEAAVCLLLDRGTPVGAKDDCGRTRS